MMEKTKNRIVNKEFLIDETTGEIIEEREISSGTAAKDGNFYKLFMQDFTKSLELIGNRKTKIFCWIISNINKNNMLLYTYRQIADKTGFSYGTVAETMKDLQDTDFLRKQKSGYYMVNPNILFKGSYERRCLVWSAYYNIPAGDRRLSEEMRLAAITKDISRLQKRADRLREALEISE